MERTQINITNETRQYAITELEGAISILNCSFAVADAEQKRCAVNVAHEVVNLDGATGISIEHYKNAAAMSNTIFMCMEQIRSRIETIRCSGRFSHATDNRIDIVVIRDKVF